LFGFGLVALHSLPVRAASVVVPIVLDVKAGSAWYRTELTLTNRGTSAVDLTLAYTGSLGTAKGSILETIAAGSQVTIPDVIARLRDKGVPLPPSGEAGPQAGTLLVTFPDSASEWVTVLARTTSPTAPPIRAGRAGLAYAGVPRTGWATGRALIYGLRTNSSDRSNLAVYNPTGAPVTLRVSVVSGSGDGREFVVSAAEVLGPGAWRQWDRVLDLGQMTNGWAVIERLSGEAFGAYGVVNDNVTNDGSFLEPVLSTQSRARRVVPAVVETESYQTELILANRAGTAATVILDYRESLSPSQGPGGNVTITLRAFEQRIIPSVLGFLRAEGISIGAAGAGNYGGSLRVTSDNGDPGDLFAGARVSSGSNGEGSFGVFLPGVTDAGLSTTQAVVAGLRSDAEVRSNLAILHAGDPGSGAIDLEVQAYNGENGGTAAGAPETFRLEEGAWKQLPDPLRGRSVRSGWFGIRRVAGSAPWSAYGVINDGSVPGERTDDGAFVPATAVVSPGVRLQPSDLSYLGAFRLPAGGERPDTFEYGGNAMTFRPGGDPASPADGYPGSLFVTGHDRIPYGELPNGSRIAEISIPAPGLAQTVENLPEARMLQGFTEFTGNLFSGLDEIPRIGLQYLDRPETGPKLHIAWGQHFQPEPRAPSHAWCDPTLSAPNPKGAWFLGNQNPYSVNGYLFEIPASWADQHTGGRVLGTGRYRDGGWSGMGPSLFAYRPWTGASGTPASPGAHLSETPLLLYANSQETDRIERCLSGYQHSDAWEGAAWITTASGKAALVFAGTKTVGSRYWYGYINPAGSDLPCVDGAFVGQFDVCRTADGSACPSSELVECTGHTSARGWWGSRAVARLIFYDPADLARVAAGTMAPDLPQPYAALDIDSHLFLNPAQVELDEIGTGVQRRYRLGDVTLDRENGLLYVLELFADGAAPVIHVFRVQ
jgi:hypothetical protein